MKETEKNIFLVIPKIIEQPTWGGGYIIDYKNWSKKPGLQGMKIGQSYELYSGTNLNKSVSSSGDANFNYEIGYAMQPDKIVYKGDKQDILSINDLIQRNPEAVLGKTVMQKHGGAIKILIKFTQAMGNSFQVHAREKDKNEKWLAKPESWYYFEPGLLTLGIKNPSCWTAYEKACKNIEEKMKALAVDIKSGAKTLWEAKNEARVFVKEVDPWQFVNTVKAEKDGLIDLSRGGIHHSWEEDKTNYPLGNIVYELCLDVMDPVSSIRSFDKGKIKNDGTIREVHIEDYFALVDRDEKTNKPENHILSPHTLLSDKDLNVESLLRSNTYCLDKLSLDKAYGGEHTRLNGSYHHLFMKEGEALIRSEHSSVKLTKGHSCFVPAGVGEYSIHSDGEEKCVILKTFVQ